MMSQRPAETGTEVVRSSPARAPDEVVPSGWAYVVATREWAMTERRVLQTGKDAEGEILSLCNAGETWSPRLKADAIDDIETRQYRYYVEEAAPRVYVHALHSSNGKYLRTTAESSSANNLENLPDW